MAGKLAESWIKLDLKVNLKMVLKVDQELTKGSLKSWLKVTQSCTKVNRKLMRVGFESWSKLALKVDQILTKVISQSWSTVDQKPYESQWINNFLK